jgi:aminopeptidase-like protein
MHFLTGLNKATVLSILYLFLFSSKASAQADFFKHVSFLASDSLHGRAPGTADEKAAGAYISKFLGQTCNARVKLQTFGYAIDSVNRQQATNIIGIIDRHKKQTILLSAHYDHLGMHSLKSADLTHKSMIHPGADDNASGVAMVMELTGFLSSQKSLPFNVVTFFSSAHEDGLFGSEYFARSGIMDSMNVVMVLNFDMVGRLDTTNRTLRVGAFSTDSAITNFFVAHDTDNLHFRFDDSNIDFSDLKYFRPLQIPLLHFTTGTHQDYHRSSDVVAKINFDGMTTIFDFMKRFLYYLETSNQPPFKRTK